MQFVLRCKLNSKTATDINSAGALFDMVKTGGYKIIWYDFSDATVTEEDNNGQLIYQIATNATFGHTMSDANERTKFNISTAFSHLHVLFQDITPRQIGKSSLISYELKGVVLKVEDNTL